MLAANCAFPPGPVTRGDLDALRLLRAEFSQIFALAAGGSPQLAAGRLNALLIQHPVHPELVSHDSTTWHVHLADTGSLAGKFAAGAVFGLTLFLAQFGIDRLGVCTIAACPRVFLDASTNRSRRYCAEHGAARGNVMTLPPGRPQPSGGSAATAAS